MALPLTSSLPEDHSQWPAVAFGAELPQALRWLCAPHLVLAVQREEAKWRNAGAPGRDDLERSPSIFAQAYALSVMKLHSDFVERLASGALRAWGRVDSIFGPWIAIPPESWVGLKVVDWVAGTVTGGGVKLYSVRAAHPWGVTPEIALRLFGSLKAADSVDRGDLQAREYLSEQMSVALRLGSLVAIATSESGDTVQLLPNVAWQTLHLDIAAQSAGDDQSRFVDAGILPAAYTPAVLPDPPWFLGNAVEVPYVVATSSERMTPGSGSGEMAIRRRGPKGGLTDHVASKILADLRSGTVSDVTFYAEKQDNWVTHYSAGSRDTLTKAWNRALSQHQADIRQFDNSSREQ